MQSSGKERTQEEHDHFTHVELEGVLLLSARLYENPPGKQAALLFSLQQVYPPKIRASQAAGTAKDSLRIGI